MEFVIYGDDDDDDDTQQLTDMPILLTCQGLLLINQFFIYNILKRNYSLPTHLFLTDRAQIDAMLLIIIIDYHFTAA